jgi:hypothetical protein
MTVLLSPVGGVAAQFFDNNGNPLTGGKLFSYAAGTTTPAATYTSSLGTTAHTNPIILDAGGRVPGGEIWLTDGVIYKFVLQTSTNVLIATYDNIVGINSNFVNYTTEQEIQTATAGQTVFNLTTTQYQPGTNSLSVFVDGVNQYGPGAQYAYLETDSNTVTFVSGLHVGASVKFTTATQTTGNATDASVVSYTPPFTNSVTTNVEDKLAQTISVIDFGADSTGATDSTTAFQNAINYGIANNRQVVIPSGQYNITTVTVLNPAYNFGIHSFDARILGIATTPTAGIFQFINCVDFNVTGNIHFISGNNVNYSAGLFISTALGGNQSTTRVNIYNPSFRNFKIAMWIGEITVDRQCSEINVFGANMFSCPISLYLAGSQTLASFNGCNLVSEPNTALLPTADEKCIWVEGGVVTVVGGKIVKAVTPTEYAIQLNVSNGPTFGNSYGAVRISGTHIETASALAVINNPRALVSTTSLTSNLTIVASGGYVGPSSIADDFITVSDAGYAGIIHVENCNFYSSTLQRTAFNISSAAPNVKIQTDRKSFNEGFLNWVGGVSGGNMFHDLIAAVLSTGINATIPAAETVLKFVNNITTFEYGRYGGQYNTSTGLFTVTQTDGFSIAQLVASIDGGGGTGILTVKVNGNIIVTAPYASTGTIVANLPRFFVGDTVGVYFTPTAPVALDSSTKQRLSIQLAV